MANGITRFYAAPTTARATVLDGLAVPHMNRAFDELRWLYAGPEMATWLSCCSKWFLFCSPGLFVCFVVSIGLIIMLFALAFPVFGCCLWANAFVRTATVWCQLYLPWVLCCDFGDDGAHDSHEKSLKLTITISFLFLSISFLFFI